MKKLIRIIGCLMMFIFVNQANAQIKDTFNANVEIVKEDANAVVQHPGFELLQTTDSDVSDRVKLFAIFCVFALPPLMVIAIILIVSYNRRKQESGKLELMQKAIESGKEIPVGFFAEKNNPKKLLNRGITWLSIGAGIFIFIFFVINKEFSTVACIPFFIGLGQVVAYFMTKKEDKFRGNEADQ